MRNPQNPGKPIFGSGLICDMRIIAGIAGIVFAIITATFILGGHTPSIVVESEQEESLSTPHQYDPTNGTVSLSGFRGTDAGIDERARY